MPTLTTLVNFNGTNGSGVVASLSEDAAGDLFGTASGGGANDDGTVFEIPFANGGYASAPTTLVSFNGTNGLDPNASLFENAAGDLFGTTFEGGVNGEGTVFEVPFSHGSYATTPTVLVNFNTTNGQFPSGGVFADSAGNLFGTTEFGGADDGGTMFEIPYVNGSYASAPTTLVNFNTTFGSPVAGPDSGLITDAAGDLFGTTDAGGTNDAPTVFEIPFVNGSYASTPTTLLSYNSIGLTVTAIDAAGDLFGTTEFGGANGDGMVFEIVKTGGSYASTPTTLASFNATDGEYPRSGVIMDAAGNLFGTTRFGGANNDGTVFEIAHTGDGYASTPTVLLDFDGTNGANPQAGLIADSAGDLFGSTTSGGASGDGTAFELIICYLAGTQIATPLGEVPVEQLAVGDLAMTLRGEPRRIVWIGEGHVLATRGRRNAATPVIVRKGALADNVPHHDLRITKAHALYIDDVLIPVEFLVNHRSILWDDQAQEITLYHVELESHDVLLANGAPAESYRDDGNRWLFRNANSGWGLPPQAPCAPVVTGGAVVDEAWRRLLERAGPRPGVPLTDDPDLHLCMDGQRLDAAERVGEAYVFHLPAVPPALRIVSNAAAPAELGLARDPRVLGVAVRRLVVREGTRFRVTEAHDDRLTDGFHAFEADNGFRWGFRWTDGDAAVPAALFAGFSGPP